MVTHDNFHRKMQKLGYVAKTAIISTLFFVTPLTMTGCSFDFSKDIDNLKEIVQPLTDEITEVGNLTVGSINAVKEATAQIDQSDFKDVGDVENLMTDMYETGQKIADENGIEFVRATLVRVVDGDTLVVSIDGEEQKVRLIGVDTPESVASQEYLDRTGKENTEAGKTASEYTKSLLENITDLYLQSDKGDTDRYGRLLRYVWVEKPTDAKNAEEIATKMLNGILVRNGYAELATYPPNTLYKADFEYIYKMSHGETYEDGDYDMDDR
jgi:endonuclease YncB( thermonuclease family)